MSKTTRKHKTTVKRPKARAREEKAEPHSLGAPRFDLKKALTLASLMEDEQTVRKLVRRRQNPLG